LTLKEPVCRGGSSGNFHLRLEKEESGQKLAGGGRREDSALMGFHDFAIRARTRDGGGGAGNWWGERSLRSLWGGVSGGLVGGEEEKFREKQL
jgi:hypothetical protein